MALQGLTKPVSRALRRGQALAACHLANAERRDPTKRLLLAAHVDMLFARHLLSFELQWDDFRAVVAPRAQPVAANLGITPGMPLASSVPSRNNTSRVGQCMAGDLARFRQKKADAAASS